MLYNLSLLHIIKSIERHDYSSAKNMMQIELRFDVPLHSMQNRLFWRCSSQPIFWLGIEEIKSNTTTADNTRIK